MPDPKTFVGAGKLAEIKSYIKENEIEVAVFDDELSPSQIRNIENELECKILDRNNLILYIFAKRAKTAYAKTQVELAQYEYLLPRLTRMWTHLTKQRGGIGMRGPGEKEIETDRRVIRDRISLLKEKLKIIDKQMMTQRGNRGGLLRVALVGYTNVGKSTIMNLISKSNVFAENKLFATLDTTVRKVVIENLPFLLSDTVGFIRKLPVGLVESFKSTLDEVREADILLHIVDISHPNFEEQIDVVRQTLKEIKSSDKPTIIVFNKIDAYTFIEKEADDLTPSTKENITLDELRKTWMSKENMPCIFISAKEKQNIEDFKMLLYQRIKEIHTTRYPYNNFLY
jgi:GTP-binding protein HflX